MGGSPTPTDCRFDEPCNATDVNEIDWEVSLTDQFGWCDALALLGPGRLPRPYLTGGGARYRSWPDQETATTVIEVRSGTGGSRPRVCWPRR
jgi:hypothetical protein